MLVLNQRSVCLPSCAGPIHVGTSHRPSFWRLHLMFGGIARTITRINKNQQKSTEIDKNIKNQQESSINKTKLDHVSPHLLVVRFALEPSPFPQIHPTQLQYLVSQVSQLVRLEDMEILAPKLDWGSHHCCFQGALRSDLWKPHKDNHLNSNHFSSPSHCTAHSLPTNVDVSNPARVSSSFRGESPKIFRTLFWRPFSK